MANLITGDAITLDLRIAGLPSRSLALAVDLTIQVGLLVAGTVLVSWVFSAGGQPRGPGRHHPGRRRAWPWWAGRRWWRR